MRRPKIAELPDHLRQEVNHKLLAGETCDDIAEWLNHEIEAKTIAAARWGTCYSASNVHRYHANQFQHWIKAQQPDQCADETKDALVQAGAQSQALLNELELAILVRIATALPKKDFPSHDSTALVAAVTRLGRLSHSTARVDIARQKVLVQHEEKTSITYSQIIDWVKKHPQQGLRLADIVDPPGTPLPERDVEDAVFASLGLNPDDIYNRDQ